VDEEGIEGIRVHFAHLDSEGFDHAVPHLWEHSVAGSTPSDLLQFADRVAELGFDVLEREPFQVPGRDTYVLNVRREQVHTPESLAAECDDLASLAEEYGLSLGGHAVRWTTE